MDIKTRKLHLIEWLAKTQDESLLARIEQIVQDTPLKQYQSLLGDGSDDALRNMVKEGTADWQAGRVHTTEELKARFRNKRK